MAQRPSRAHRRHYKQAAKSAKRLRTYTPGKSPESTAERMRLIVRLLFNVAMQSIRGDKDTSERVMYEGFMSLGGVYVKFLQLMMMRTRLFSKLTASERMAVYDRVSVDDIDIHAQLERQLDSRYREQIVHVDDKPFAGGSFAQVYMGQHIDGTKIILKVLRPSLIENVHADLRILGFIVFILRHRMKVATDMRALFKNFRSVVLKETDYVTEVNNAEYFYNYFANNADIVIPRTYSDICTYSVIVQEFVDGLAATELIEAIGMGHDAKAYTANAVGSDLVAQANVLGRELIVGMYTADRVFGDTHPGNIKLLSGNRVGIIDFGIAGEPPEDRQSFMILMQNVIAICNGNFDEGETFINGMRFFTSDLYRAINTLSESRASILDQKEGESIIDEIKRTAGRALQSSQAQADIEALARSGKVSKIMNSVINKDNKFAFNVRIDEGAAIAMRTADGYVSLLESLGLIDELIPNVLQEGVDRVYQKGGLLKGNPETIEYETAVNIASDWAQNLIESDPVFFSSLIQKLRDAVSAKPAPSQQSAPVVEPVAIEENSAKLSTESEQTP